MPTYQRRQDDPVPFASETFQEYIDRTVCGQPAPRLWYVWGWPAPDSVVTQHPKFMEPSWVFSPAATKATLNLSIRS